LDAPLRQLDISGSPLGLSGDLTVVDLGGRVSPVLWRGNPPDSMDLWPNQEVEAAIACELVREHEGDAGPCLVLFRGEDSPRQFLPERGSDPSWRPALEGALACACGDKPPQPLDGGDSRCGNCALLGLCLPDETSLLGARPAGKSMRCMTPRDDVLPLHIQTQGARVQRSGEVLEITKGGKELASVPIKDIAQVILHGNIQITTQAMNFLLNQGIPVTHLSTGGWFYGISHGLDGGNLETRRSQYRLTEDPIRCLEMSRPFIEGKIANQRTQLRRNGKMVPDRVLSDMAKLETQCQDATTTDQLRGLEGLAAHLYFSHFVAMLRPRVGVWSSEEGLRLEMEGRNRRPPRDPVNALLSYAYGVLVRECTVACAGVGLDPMAGFFHVPRPGRPSLALDLMEEFRPVAADSAVITAINTGMVGPSDFRQVGDACWLASSGKKALLQAWENRLDQLATHPLFDYRCSLRRIIRLQARMLAKRFLGETGAYVPYRIR